MQTTAVPCKTGLGGNGFGESREYRNRLDEGKKANRSGKRDDLIGGGETQKGGVSPGSKTLQKIEKRTLEKERRDGGGKKCITWIEKSKKAGGGDRYWVVDHKVQKGTLWPATTRSQWGGSGPEGACLWGAGREAGTAGVHEETRTSFIGAHSQTLNQGQMTDVKGIHKEATSETGSSGDE